MTKGPDPRRLEVPKHVLDSYLGRSINQATFKNSLSKFEDNNSDFFKHYEEGHPISLMSASEEVEGILVRMMNYDQWTAFRRTIETHVNKTKDIKNAVCLALGRYVRWVDGAEGIWTSQYAVFVYVCQLIDNKQRLECKKQNLTFNPIKRYYQDPAFDTRTKYILQKIERRDDPGENIVLEHPEATNLIDDSSFVYGIHIMPSMWKDMLKRDEQHRPQFPQLLITNDIRGEAGGYDCAMTEKFIEESCLKTFPSPEFIELRVVLDKFQEMYEETPFPTVPVHFGAFQGVAMYQPTAHQNVR